MKHREALSKCYFSEPQLLALFDKYTKFASNFQYIFKKHFFFFTIDKLSFL